MSSNKSKKILVVDDEVDILELLKYNLKKEGYSVKTVSNGIDAVETAKDFFTRLGAFRHYDAASGRCRDMSPITRTHRAGEYFYYISHSKIRRILRSSSF